MNCLEGLTCLEGHAGRLTWEDPISRLMPRETWDPCADPHNGPGPESGLAGRANDCHATATYVPMRQRLKQEPRRAFHEHIGARDLTGGIDLGLYLTMGRSINGQVCSRHCDTAASILRGARTGKSLDRGCRSSNPNSQARKASEMCAECSLAVEFHGKLPAISLQTELRWLHPPRHSRRWARLTRKPFPDVRLSAAAIATGARWNGHRRRLRSNLGARRRASERLLWILSGRFELIGRLDYVVVRARSHLLSVQG